MIGTTCTRQLHNRIHAAKLQLKNCKTVEERIALANYIGNVYSSIGAVLDIKVPFKRKPIFGSNSNYKKFIKKLDIANAQMLDSYVLSKSFHEDYIGEIIPEVEENMKLLEDDEISPTTTVSDGEFYDIFFDFMKSIKLDSLFEKFVKEGRIYKTVRKSDEPLLGFTLFNPINKEADVFVGDFEHNIHSLFTMAHEFGHVYDLNHFDQDMDHFNRYFYQSFYGETLSKLFERLFVDYMIKNNILIDESKDKLFEILVVNHDYLLSAYILSLLDGSLFENEAYKFLSKDELTELVKEHFISEEGIKEYISGCTTFDIHEVYNYSYGDIISRFLQDSIEQGGFSNELMNAFLERRSEMFSREFLEEWGMGPANYTKLHKKDVEILKK